MSVVQAIGPQALAATASASSEISLAGRFAVPDVAGSVVRFDTNAPQQNASFFVELFDNLQAAPVRVTTATAQNFLKYVNDASYDRSIIHRSVPGFVIQGGGFFASASAATPPESILAAIPSKGTVADEVGNPNQRGTISMAKVSQGSGATNPNSATSQWFINIDDNPGLDSEFSAFGRVLGNGMTVVDALAAVPWYDASDYFLNNALTNLPLWGVPSDGYIRPEHLVTVNDVGVASAAALLRYSVSTQDTAVIKPEILQDRLVLSRVGTAHGTAIVTVRVTAAFDATDFVDHSFSVTVPPLPPPPPVTIETQGLVTLAYDSAGRLLANGTPLTLGGKAVDYNAMNAAGWRAVAAETIGGVNTLVWRHASGSLHFWRLSGSWAQQSSDGWQSPGSTDFNATEVALGMDFNSDGFVGPALTGIESVGNVSLARDRAGSLFAGTTRITLSGSPVDYAAYDAAGWRAVAAETIGGVNTLVWRHASGSLHFWRLSGSWAQQSSDGWQSPGGTDFNATEVAFGMDFNSDGVVGAALTRIESVGNVSLGYDAAGRLFAGGTPITLGGNPVDFNAMRTAGWRAVAAETIGGVNTLVWRHASRNLHFWRLSGAWAQQSSDGWQAPGSSEYFATERAFGMDFNGDSVVGGPLTIIENVGAVALGYDDGGHLYANRTRITLGGNPVDFNAMNASGWRAVAAEAVAGVNTLTWRHSSGNLHFWRLSSDWAQQSSDGWQGPRSAAYAASEITFGIDFNGNGSLGG